MGRAAANGLTCGLIGFLLVCLLAPSLGHGAMGRWQVAPSPTPNLGDIAPSDADAVSEDARIADPSQPGETETLPVGDDGQHPEDGSASDGAVDGAIGRFHVPDWAFAFPFFVVARVRKDRLLEHPFRRRVVDTVHEHPGINHRELRRMLGVANGTLEYHLRQLESARYLSSIRAHGRKYLFVNGDRWAAQLAIVTERERDVLGVLSQVQLAALEDVGRALGIGTKGASYHLRRLRAEGLVGCRRRGHALVFFRSEGGPTSKMCTTNGTRA